MGPRRQPAPKAVGRLLPDTAQLGSGEDAHCAPYAARITILLQKEWVGIGDCGRQLLGDWIAWDPHQAAAAPNWQRLACCGPDLVKNMDIGGTGSPEKEEEGCAASAMICKNGIPKCFCMP